MPQFNYEGVNKYGDKVRGILLADSELDLRIKLRRQNIRPSKIVKENLFEANAKPLHERELVFFIKEFALMLNNGLTTDQALGVLESTAYAPRLRILASRLLSFIRHGNTFSQAMAQYPNIFDELLLNLVAVGELKGRLADVLNSWIEFKEKEGDLNSIASRSIIFPTFIILVLLSIFSLSVFGLEPLLLKVYGANIPSMVLKSVKVSKYLSFTFFITLAVSISVLIPSYLIYGRAKIESFFRRVFIRIPIFSRFMRKYLSAKALLILGFTTKMEFPLKRALYLVASLIKDPNYEDLFLQAKESVAKREPLAAVLAKSSYFPPVVVQMLSVAEIMGNMEQALNDSYKYVYEDVLVYSKTLNTVLEPFVLILGGILVGILATMLVLPLVVK